MLEAKSGRKTRIPTWRFVMENKVYLALNLLYEVTKNNKNFFGRIKAQMK